MWRLCATSASLGVFSVRIILCSFKASSITQKTAIIHRQPPVTCPSRLLPNCKNVSERCQTDAPSADHCPGWCCKRVSACSFLNHKAPACPDTSLTLIQTARSSAPATTQHELHFIPSSRLHPVADHCSPFFLQHHLFS